MDQSRGSRLGEAQVSDKRPLSQQGEKSFWGNINQKRFTVPLDVLL